MPKSFVTTVAAWRFERPLAVVLAASATFMALAVPPARLAFLPATPGVQPVLAVVFGLALGALGYAAMAYPWPRAATPNPDPVETEAPEHEQGQFAAGEVSLRLRRADRHPDAPVREPIFASRDLGSPFMEVGAAAPSPAPDAIIEGDYAEIAHDAPVTEPVIEPVTGPAAEPVSVAVEPASAVADGVVPIAAFAPEDEPAPTPARPPRESIAAMMERLSAGLERRAAHGGIDVMPQQRRPALREALDELNRLAARRG